MNEHVRACTNLYMNSSSYFPKVKEAREALKAKALELYELQLEIVKTALANGEFEVAAKANQWLIEHMPAEDGTKMIDTSIDTNKIVEKGPTGPMINIGFQLGGINQTKELPLPTVSVVDGESQDVE